MFLSQYDKRTLSMVSMDIKANRIPCGMKTTEKDITEIIKECQRVAERVEAGICLEKGNYYAGLEMEV